jgi:hypothetical protein
LASGKTLPGLKGLTCEKARPEANVKIEIEKIFFIVEVVDPLKIETGINPEPTAQKKSR